MSGQAENLNMLPSRDGEPGRAGISAYPVTNQHRGVDRPAQIQPGLPENPTR